MTPQEPSPSAPLPNPPGDPTPDPSPQPSALATTIGQNPYTGMPSTMTQDPQPAAPSSAPVQSSYAEPGIPAPASVAVPAELAFVPSAPAADQAQPLFDKPRRNKKLIVLGLVAAALFVLFGGTAAVYALWYNNPRKVMADALQNYQSSVTMINDGTVTIRSEAGDQTWNADISFNSKFNNSDVNGELAAKLKLTMGGKTQEISGGGMLSQTGSAYFRFDQVQELVDEVLADETVMQYAAVSPELEAQLKAFAKKIDGTWIKVDKDYIKQFAPDFDYDKAKRCFQEAYRQFQGDRGQQAQVRDAFEKNEFLVLTQRGMEPVDGTNTNSYGVTVNVAAYYDAMKAIEQSAFSKKIMECTTPLIGELAESATAKPSDDSVREQQQAIDKVKFTANITPLSHELKRVSIDYDDSESKTSVDAVIGFTQNKPVNVQNPGESVSIKDLQADLDKLFSRFMEENEAAMTAQDTPAAIDTSVRT